MKDRKMKERKDYRVPKGMLGAGYLIAMLAAVALLVSLAGMVQATDINGAHRSATTDTKTGESGFPWQVTEMVCCHCYSTLSDGRRFYHGILEAGFCRSQRGYCEGYAKCFQ